MTVNRNPDQLIRAFVLEGEDELPDRIYDVVRGQLHETQQRVVIGSWRMPLINKSVGIALAAAAVVVIAIVGYQLLLGPNVGGPNPTDSPQPTPAPAPSGAAEELPVSGLLVPGTYTFLPAGGTRLRGTLTVPAGWHALERAAVLKNASGEPPDGAGLLSWAGNLNVFGDPCQWAGSLPDPPTGPTVDDLVAALLAQPVRDASAPTDIAVDGYSGVALELTVPADLDFADCDSGEFRSWTNAEGAVRFHQGPGQHDLLWIIDVNGTRVVIDSGFFSDGTSAVDIAELQAIRDSIQFRP